VGVSVCCKKKNKEGRCEFVFEKEVCACVYKNIDVCVCCTDRECLQRKKWVYMCVCACMCFIRWHLYSSFKLKCPLSALYICQKVFLEECMFNEKW
jgi:hypothetical protein